MELQKFESGENIHDPTFREKLNALVEAVNEIGGGGATSVLPAEFTESRMEFGIPVRITAHGVTGQGYYQFTEVEDSSSGDAEWADKAGGLGHTELGEARAVGHWSDQWFTYPLIGRVVYIKPGLVMDSGGNRIWEFTVSAPLLFPVTLVEDGNGSAGTYSTQCSFAYDVQDDNGATLAMGVDPTASPHTHQRPSFGPMNAATEGLAYWADNSGTPQLRIVYVNESLNYEFVVCS